MKRISEKRRAVYYLGMGLMAVGGLLFLSVFVTGALNFGNFHNFDVRVRSGVLRAVFGMFLLFVGAAVRVVAARGLAGSGVVLDPEKARDELEPYSRMAGGLVKDALDEAGVDLGRKPEKVVMLKCPACGKLNEEDSKFCRECGTKL